MDPSPLSDNDYQRLLEFRTGLRRFLHWSAAQAQAAGLTPAQHQLLLAIRGDPGPGLPTVGDIAEELILRHHSAVELIDRAEAAGLVARTPDPDDHRTVRISLTPHGAHTLEALARAHKTELVRLNSRLAALWQNLD